MRNSGCDRSGWRTRVFIWDRGSLDSAHAIRAMLERSAAWSAYLRAFGPPRLGLVWIEINRCRAAVGFTRQRTRAQVRARVRVRGDARPGAFHRRPARAWGRRVFLRRRPVSG